MSIRPKLAIDNTILINFERDLNCEFIRVQQRKAITEKHYSNPDSMVINFVNMYAGDVEIDYDKQYESAINLIESLRYEKLPPESIMELIFFEINNLMTTFLQCNSFI